MVKKKANPGDSVPDMATLLAYLQAYWLRTRWAFGQGYCAVFRDILVKLVVAVDI